MANDQRINGIGWLSEQSEHMLVEAADVPKNANNRE